MVLDEIVNKIQTVLSGKTYYDDTRIYVGGSGSVDDQEYDNEVIVTFQSRNRRQGRTGNINSWTVTFEILIASQNASFVNHVKDKIDQLDLSTDHLSGIEEIDNSYVVYPGSLSFEVEDRTIYSCTCNISPYT